MITIIAKEFKWSMGHRLQNHEGKCRNLHGHNYRAVVEVWGQIDLSTGMVMDFYDFKPVKEYIDKYLDHRMLLQYDDPIYQSLGGMPIDPTNGTPTDTFLDNPGGLMPFLLAPTAENLAQHLFDMVDRLLFNSDAQAMPDNVTVWETDTCYARYSRKED